MNPYNPASNGDIDSIRCQRCFKSKHKQEFVKNKKRARIPLGEIQNNILEGTKLSAECRECRERRNQRERKRTEEKKVQTAEVNNAKLDSYSKHSWEELQGMIEDGYVPCRIQLTTTSRSLEAHKEVLISDFYRFLPEEITKENQQAISQFIVSQLSQPEGLHFSPHTTKAYSSDVPKSRPKVFANANVFRYTCSQRQRILKPSNLPYGRTRNRRARIELFNCTGTIILILPAASSNAPFDFSFAFNHDVHPGREHLGLPLKVREWIKQNPRPTSIIQREELMRAISRGELPSVQGQYLRPMHIHYWWRKATKEHMYPTKDSWENCFRTLQEHPMVFPFAISPKSLTIGNKRYLPDFATSAPYVVCRQTVRDRFQESYRGVY